MKGGGKRGLSTPPPCPPPQEILSSLSFANYGMFIYTQRPVIDANMLRKNVFSDFPFPFAQFDLLS